MKVKQYFVNEIMDLKSEIKQLRLEVAKRESRIELLEKNEFDFKSNLNKEYGVIGAVRELIANNLRYDDLTGTAVGVSMKPDDFKDMLELLDINPVEDESKNQNEAVKNAPVHIEPDCPGCKIRIKHIYTAML